MDLVDTTTDADYVVRFNDQPCPPSQDYWVFCEGSDWGDEEATVVCKDSLHSEFGLGSEMSLSQIYHLSLFFYTGYVGIEVPYRDVGFSYISCNGSESGLEDCQVGNLTTHNCTRAGAITCFNSEFLYNDKHTTIISFSIFTAPQIFLHSADTISDQFVDVLENESFSLCVILWGPIIDDLSVVVATNDSGLATGKEMVSPHKNSFSLSVSAYDDYRPLNQTITFEATDSLRTNKCIEIEIVDDSLAEDWEMFTVLLSTNSSAVNNTIRPYLDVFIKYNDGYSNESTEYDNEGEGTKAETGAIIAAVVVVLLLSVIVAVAIVCIIAFLKHKTGLLTTKSLRKASAVNHIYETNMTFRQVETEKHLDNPGYDPERNNSTATPQVDQSPEHHLVNPLYTVETGSSKPPHTYAVLETDGPEYAIPAAQSADAASAFTGKPVYDYVES